MARVAQKEKYQKEDTKVAGVIAEATSAAVTTTDHPTMVTQVPTVIETSMSKLKQ